MKIRIKNIFLLFIFLTSTYFAFGQNTSEKWTLNKCIKYAYENNISVKKQYLNVEYNKNIYKQSKASILPNLNAGTDYNVNFGRSVDQFTNEFNNTTVQSSNFYISSSINIFDGFQTIYSIKKNKYSLLSSIEDTEKMKNDISLNISTAYLQILFSIEILKMSENQLDLTKKQETRISKLVNAGSLSQDNLLDIQAQIANEELQLLNSQNQLSNSYLTIIQLLELKNDSIFSIEIPQLPVPDSLFIPYTIDEIYNTAQNLPEIRSASYKVSSEEMSLSISKGKRMPKLDLTATYATGYSDARKNYILGDPKTVPIGYVGSSNDIVYSISPTYNSTNYQFQDQLKDNANKSIGLRLTIPIYNNRQIQTEINNSKINLENSKYGLEIEKNNLYKDIQIAFHDAQAALLKYKSSKKAVIANNISFENTEKKYILGTVNSNDFYISKNKFQKAESDLLQAKYEYYFKKSVLDFYSGKKIVLK